MGEVGFHKTSMLESGFGVKLGNLVDGGKAEPILVERDINNAARVIEAR